MLPKNKLDSLRSSNDLIILEELDIQLRYQKYWWLSILIFPLIMIVASFNLLTIVEATVIGAIILLVLRSISMEEAYESINWAVIFLIALLVPIGIAMEKTGTGEFISYWILDLAQYIGNNPRYSGYESNFDFIFDNFYYISIRIKCGRCNHIITNCYYSRSALSNPRY